MKTYVAPHYEREYINSNDVILTSPEDVSVLQVNKSNAQVSASVWDILGLR